MNEHTPENMTAALPPRRVHTTEPELLTVDEVASLLRVGRNRVYEYARHHYIPTLRIGKGYRFPRRKLLEWIDLQAGLDAQG